MWDPMPTLEPLLAGQGSVEPASKRAKRAGDERDGGVQLHALEGSSRHDLGKGATGPLHDAQGGPLVASKQTCVRDRDLVQACACANSQAE